MKSLCHEHVDLIKRERKKGVYVYKCTTNSQVYIWDGREKKEQWNSKGGNDQCRDHQLTEREREWERVKEKESERGKKSKRICEWKTSLLQQQQQVIITHAGLVNLALLVIMIEEAFSMQLFHFCSLLCYPLLVAVMLCDDHDVPLADEFLIPLVQVPLLYIN